jgi:mono/diheme cytochrome c family protein
VGAQPPPFGLADLSGEELFGRFCVSCHGEAARGDGPVAATLDTVVPDLTRIRERHGEFSAARVREFVDGRSIVVAHGTRYMPVWGYEFWVEEGADVAAARGATDIIERLVENLGTIQTSATTSPDGTAIFTTYCASCHGAQGEGDGPVSSALRVTMPNLRSLAERNGGRYPAGRVASYIDGRRVPAAHGGRYMPVWGEVFASTGDGESADVQQRIDALVDYLREIQYRPTR